MDKEKALRDISFIGIDYFNYDEETDSVVWRLLNCLEQFIGPEVYDSFYGKSMDEGVF